MKFTCDTKELSKACQTVSRAVATKTTVPTLEGIKIDADADGISVCGYNLELGITTRISAQSISEEGSTVLDAKTLCNIVKKLPDVHTDISIDEKDTATIESGTTNFTIVGLSAKEFPNIPAVDKKSEVNIPQPVLKSMIQQTLFAISENDSKPMYTGAQLAIENGKLTMVGIDGYRLAVCKETIDYSGANFDFIVPAKTLMEVSRLLSDDANKAVHISVGIRHAIFAIGDYEIFTRLLEGDFLDYKAVLPKQCATSLKVNVQDFAKSVQRVSLLISDKLRSPIVCDFSGTDGTIKLSSNTAMGRASDSIPAEISGEDVHIGFNHKYLADALSHTDCDEVRLQLNSPLSPMVILPDAGDSFVFLVLPVRLRAAGNES